MREAIDKFAGDQGRLPAGLDELVSRSYLKAIPLDPITDRRDSWVTLGEAEVQAALPADRQNPPAAGAAARNQGRVHGRHWISSV